MIRATSDNDLDRIKELIRDGKNINERAVNGDTALIIASGRGYLSIVKKLIDAGADKDAQNDLGNTALFVASSRGQLSAVKILIDAGADKNLQNKYGNTPLTLTSYNDIIVSILTSMANFIADQVKPMVDEKQVDDHGSKVSSFLVTQIQNCAIIVTRVLHPSFYQITDPQGHEKIDIK